MTKALDSMLRSVARGILPQPAKDWLLGRFARKNILPAPPASLDDSPFIPRRVLGSRGVDLRAAEQLSLLQRWKSARYQELFRLLRNDPTINTNPFGHGRAAVHNRFFPSPDAETYAAMILERQPRRI